MDELLKNCNTDLFKVGDKVRIRQDIKGLFVLRTTDIGRYSRIFPNKIQTGDSRYKITGGMVACAGKIAEVTEIIQGPPESLLLSTLYRLRIKGNDSEWCWKHALLEKVEEDSDNSAETNGAKWELPLKVGQKVSIRKNLKEGFDKFCVCGTEFRNAGIVREMEKFSGCIATITGISQNKEIVGSYVYYLTIDGVDYGWSWDISMFDGFDAWRDKQEADAKRGTESSPSFPLKVGDTVTVRHDIAERRDKSGFIWTTVDGRRTKTPLITSSMICMAGKTGKITKVYNYEGKDDFAYELAFQRQEFDGFVWGLGCLEEFHDYKAYVEGKSSKKKTPPKKSEKHGEDYYGNSKYEYEEMNTSGIKTDFFFAYDYKGRKRVFPGVNGFITKIDVTIISGDETGLIYFVKDGKANRMAFDASVGTRFISYDDGTYTVEGKDNIKRWLSWSYDKDKAKNVNYAIQHMNDFLGGDK
nr:MAG TPA: mindbomb E3 ubiquitin protein ligase [Bacteriophage sp.]